MAWDRGEFSDRRRSPWEGTMRGPSSPEAGTPDRPVLKGNRPGRRPTSPRSILRQRAPRHITLAGEALGDRGKRRAGSRAVSPRSARELSSPRGSPRPGPLSSPARTGQTQKNGARQGFCDGYRATAQGPAPGEYCRECGKRNKTSTLSGKERLALRTLFASTLLPRAPEGASACFGASAGILAVGPVEAIIQSACDLCCERFRPCR